jgi:ABC-2 type transport system ATP-binding protein
MEEAEHLAHGIVVMDAGRIVAQGTADQLKDHMGGAVLEVRVANRADLDRAADLVAGFGTAPPRLNPDLNRVSLPIAGVPRSSSPPVGR